MSTSQLDCSVGLSVAESPYGTAAVASIFYEYLSETLNADLTYTQGEGYRVGTRFDRSNRRALAKKQGGGDVVLEACSKGMGSIFKAGLGQVTTTQRGSTGVYQQVHTPAAVDFLEARTLQKGVPLIGGNTVPFTFLGSVCEQLKLSCPNGEVAQLTSTWMSREVRTDIAYAAPSYPTGLEVFTFAGGAITVGGTVTPATTTALATGGTVVADIRDFELTYTNNLDDGGFNFGSAVDAPASPRWARVRSR
jgi:hypothetical protein